MLIYFEISNLFSFHQPARLTMEAVPRQRRHKNHEIPGRGRNDPALLRVAAIYGANASGKSNLVRSMELVANLVEHGVALDKAIPCPRFKLDPAAAQAPAEAEVAFKIDGRAYLYRLAWTPQAIHYEALFRHRPDGEPGPRDILFERHGGPATNPAPATPAPPCPPPRRNATTLDSSPAARAPTSRFCARRSNETSSRSGPFGPGSPRP